MEEQLSEDIECKYEKTLLWDLSVGSEIPLSVHILCDHS